MMTMNALYELMLVNNQEKRGNKTDWRSADIVWSTTDHSAMLLETRVKLVIGHVSEVRAIYEMDKYL